MADAFTVVIVGYSECGLANRTPWLASFHIVGASCALTLSALSPSATKISTLCGCTGTLGLATAGATAATNDNAVIKTFFIIISTQNPTLPLREGRILRSKFGEGLCHNGSTMTPPRTNSPH